MNQTLLETKALSISVGEKVLLREINLSFFETGLVAVLGENGAGKSTLLKEIYHHSLTSPKWKWNQGKKKLSYLGHELGFYSSLSLEENLDYFSKLDGTKPDLEKRKTLLEAFRLQKRIWDPIHTFSRGMKQKVAILRVLLSSAEMILFDEPYTGLDAESSKILSELLNLESKSRIILIVLHSVPKELQCTSQLQIEKGGVIVTHLT
ncbi:ABC transporter ATP-binding protein [Leptospira kanakyensis]|uniref:ATP-binding cassette domain-containing protein n=1 Tax=Leptospira kanakyensis TaxID=2484968 RepID=A0A6N4QKV2_9LEPT|nr:ATP-binding cassette domain-containing protein [Leptospira kanakyensis]MCW7482026.1 ATP-binding cassette domain-containing protein [Leptospira kanakyensis]TGK53469.1 ATP-binding cassette domain-containing protein [Leptospira kanakyensis]TGK57264.1 ATP-binding cassette domain-containing protein [Leptospira kanakyensis]TGK72975.1 ATP-binding cassette domain-containing protein [Leptospira kanakyensis]